jgi:hypothetical protein
LFDSEQFLEYQVGHAADTHLPPRFSVIVVLVLKEPEIFFYLRVVQGNRFPERKFKWSIAAYFQLNQRKNTVIDKSGKFGFHRIAHFLFPLFLDTPDAHGLDIQLVGYAGWTQDSPGSTVIGCLVFKKFPASADYFAKLFERFIHKVGPKVGRLVQIER